MVVAVADGHAKDGGGRTGDASGSAELDIFGETCGEGLGRAPPLSKCVVAEGSWHDEEDDGRDDDADETCDDLNRAEVGA